MNVDNILGVLVLISSLVGVVCGWYLIIKAWKALFPTKKSTVVKQQQPIATPQACGVVSFGPIKLNTESIIQITSQKETQESKADPRIKIIYYEQGTHQIYASFSEILEKLAGYNFYRINQQQVVNLDRVESFVKGKLQLKGVNQTFSVSPKQTTELLQRLNHK